MSIKVGDRVAVIEGVGRVHPRGFTFATVKKIQRGGFLLDGHTALFPEHWVHEITEGILQENWQHALKYSAENVLDWESATAEQLWALHAAMGPLARSFRKAELAADDWRKFQEKT